MFGHSRSVTFLGYLDAAANKAANQKTVIAMATTLYQHVMANDMRYMSRSQGMVLNVLGLYVNGL